MTADESDTFDGRLAGLRMKFTVPIALLVAAVAVFAAVPIGVLPSRAKYEAWASRPGGAG